MRSRRTSSEHQEAVARRLAQLAAELEATRAGPVARASGEASWPDHSPANSAAPDLRVVPAAARPAPAPTARVEPADEAPRVPVPGRHAAPRRTVRVAETLVPATLRGPAALGPGALTVVALVVALGMAVTAWLVVRGDPEEPTVAVGAPAPGDDLVVLPPSAPFPGPSSAPPPGPSSGSSSTAVKPARDAGTVTVDVAGRVRRPGIAVLDAGARVVDALEAAGGARPGVDLSSLNLARVLVDGEQVVVGVAAPDVGGVPTAAAPGAPVPGPLVNLNTASATELEALPEVGPVTAAAIIAWREANGGFTAVEELLEVDGIGETTLGRIAPYATV
jgi:competence protein ComEA